MRKLSLTLVGLSVLLLVGFPTRAQQSRIAERELEWNQYVLPQSTFVRQTDPDKLVLFQVPSEWKQADPGKLTFSGPNDVTFSLVVEKIPDGLPLRDYASAITQQLRDFPNVADSMVVRRTSISALEAREIVFEMTDNNDVASRRIIWTTVSGPTALSIILIVPTSKPAEIEPYFKAIVQSVTFLEKYDYAGFDALRSTVVREAKPARIDEVQTLAAALAALESSGRQATITKLAAQFASAPDVAMDLLLDGRPMVRSGAFEAMAQSRNRALEQLLLRGLNDREPLVAEQAARSIAANPNAINLVRDHSLDWYSIEPLARVWPFLNKDNQIKILNEIFARPLLPSPNLITKTSVTVRAKVFPPGVMVAPPPAAERHISISDPSRQMNALTLMRDLPASEFKLPLSSIVTAKNDALTILALQSAWVRHDVLPTAELVKLLSSSSSEVRRLAALNLSQSGTIADLKTIETYLSKPASPSSSPAAAAKATATPLTVDSLDLTISRIRLREQLATASGEARAALIKKGLSDPKLAEWVWYRFVKDDLAGARPAVESKSQRPADIRVLPLGENLFPKEVTYYAALPQPAAALDKFVATLEGLQTDSARSQANLVLMLSALREQLAQQLDSSSGDSPLLYSGINTREPLALASWYAEGAPAGIPSAERKALILRVSDRERFERTLTLYQRSIGSFDRFTDYFSGAIRFVTVIPGFVPLSAKAAIDAPVTPQKETPLMRYSLVGGTEWNGHSIKAVEHRRVEFTGHMIRDVAYLTYLGNTAVLAPDLDSLRDVLTRVASQQETLASNSNFKQLTKTPADNLGEAIYLSNLTRWFADSSVNQDSPDKSAVTESGALKISNSTWENSYQIRFNQTDWVKPFIGFKAEELTSPRELLPRTTIAYYFMNFDSVAGWQNWSEQLFGVEQRKDLTSFWAIDFEKEVLPELGPECGIALLGVPGYLGDKWELPMVAFFKLKSDKLARALESGKLVAGSNAATGSAPAHIKMAWGDLFVMVKGDFLVFANDKKAITALDQKDKLIASRDFSRAVKQSPAGLAAFGGYNVEASASGLDDTSGDSIKAQKLSLISSLMNAFHSPNFYAIATSDSVEGRFSISMDREGRFSVSELASLSKDYRLTFAQIEPRGVPVHNQERLSSLKLRIRAKAAGEIDRIKEDVTSASQTVLKISDSELELKVLPRNVEPRTALALPIKGAEFAAYLQPSAEIRSDDKAVLENAQKIAGEEKDAWKVARKLADWTYKNIKWKRVDNATAPQTLATLEADCLEFSELYVAMARSLGLPARIVSGLAYSGTSFGGHAWVEVYVGEWIELDPTWGTPFVDATHIRNSTSGAMLTYASLNLVELEVLEAPRGVAEFQKTPRALAEKLCHDLPREDPSALSSALDLGVLMDGYTELGSWDSLTETEREAMFSGYRRLLREISDVFDQEVEKPVDLRLLKVIESGEKALALVLDPSDDLLLKLAFVRRNGAWFLTEILQADDDLHIISETMRPTVKTIVDRRKDKSAPRQNISDFVRVLFAVRNEVMTSVIVADRALSNDPKNQGLRHLRAHGLARNDRMEEAIKVWKELASEEKRFAPALLSLARQYENAEDQDRKLAIEFYTRYGEAEPEDPRTHVALAGLHDADGDDARSDAEHRAALQSDPGNIAQYVSYATFLALRKRIKEAGLAIQEAEKKAGAEEDLFADLMINLYMSDDTQAPEDIARSQPERMAKSYWANYYLGLIRLDAGTNLQAIASFKRAATLKKDSSGPYEGLARSYRALRNWTAALNAADTAIRLEADSGDAYFHRACALARLGRVDEALKSLAKAIELDSDWADYIKDEADLQSLASKPAFKKLLPAPEPEP